MKCFVDEFQGMFEEEYELTTELVNKLNTIADEYSGPYRNYIVTAYVWKDGLLHFAIDGPWEC